MTNSPPTSPIGGFVELGGETCYRIEAFDRMAPFLMSIPSDSDLWMFVASGGGLTAGRGDADGALFPYDTVDRLHDAHHHTGPVTVVRHERADGGCDRWEPFDGNSDDAAIERSLYKSATGNRVVFEEVNRELELSFRYQWAASDEFGWVRTATLTNIGQTGVDLRLLDGVRNVLPWGAPLALYQQASNLVDAYKKSEVDDESGLGIFSLTARITDRTEALEVLRANTVWSCGLEDSRVHLSIETIESFKAGKVVGHERLLNGARGNYLVSSSLTLEPGGMAKWHIVGDTGQDHLAIADLRARLRNPGALAARIEESLDEARDNLRRYVASADGLQLSGRTESWSHHFTNVLFNNMRGGVFANGYEVRRDDLSDFIAVRNAAVASRRADDLAALGDRLSIDRLLEVAEETDDADFERLCHEYLPLHFSRRHGDPSRPWNRFSIPARGEDGEPELGYEGNWRDIFQNWEALALSFPRFLPSIVAKFVNASTVDGFNPYRVTREGVEWEVHSPEDPWSNIGYWGDHQIIYLLKLLEALDSFDPDAITSMLGREIFSYVDVPYRIRPYEDLIADPNSTIHFDMGRAARIDGRVAALGSDGKLLADRDGSVYRANLLEKLLVPVLAKLSNLVPDGGIWMNTQRPEWNDANNALGGGGVSVVTLCHLRRHLAFLGSRLEAIGDRELPVSDEVVQWLEGIGAALEEALPLLDAHRLEPRERKSVLDSLGRAFADYRAAVYEHGFSGKSPLAIDRVLGLCTTALRIIDHGIAANRRWDGLFHTYNQLAPTADRSGVELTHLPEMLEGQVAALSSGYLSPEEARALLKRLFESDLYHSGHRSFLLYPERELPGFMGKNVIPPSSVDAIGLLADLIEADERSLIARDTDGVLRFQGDFSCSADVDHVLERLGRDERFDEAVERDRHAVLDLFDTVFQHREYTGRSGVMYGYEGLGCVYWHMVAKLLLAVQENFLVAERRQLPADTRDGLADLYFRVRSGIGYEKTVAEFGAFPTDPYSHTPGSGGARQPGMTGQVKEEILTRVGELGVRIERGAVSFEPRLLRPEECLAQEATMRCFDLDGTPRSIDLPAGSLGFTLCQVPVVYETGDGDPWIEVVFRSGSTDRKPGNALTPALSAELFARTGRVDRIRVGIGAPAEA